MDPLTTMKTWFQRVWHERDARAIHEMFEPDGKALGLGDVPLVGPDDFCAFHAQLCQQITDIRITVNSSIQDGPMVWMICTLTARSHAGRPVAMTGTCVARVVDGKIREAHNQWDFLSLWEQLGVLPSATFATTLAAPVP